MHSTLYLFLLVYLSQIVTLPGVLVEYQLRCPDNLRDWEERSNSYICQGDAVYHCMQDQNGRYVTFCASSIWIQPDYCPEFNSKVSAIDVILCPGALDKCPGSVFLSNAIYRYPSCFRTVTRTTIKSTTTVANTTTSSISWSQAPANDDQNAIAGLFVLIIVLGILVPIIGIMCLVLLFRRFRNSRKNESGRRDSGGTEERTGFLKYMGNTTTTEQSENMKGNTAIDQRNVSEEDLRKDKEHNEKFVKPYHYEKAIEKVKKEGYIVLYGVTGSGKSTLAQYIVKKEFPEYRLHHLRGKRKQVPTFLNDGGLLFWDDCFGIWNISDNDNKDDILKCITGIICKCNRNPQTFKAVFSFNSFFFDMYKLHDNIASTMDVTKSYEAQLVKEQFRKMAPNKISKIGNVSKEVGFPLLISLTVEYQYPEDTIENFLSDPTSVLKKRFQNLLKDDLGIYVTLIYAVCNCPVNLKDVSKEKWDILQKECEEAESCESGKEEKNRDNEMDTQSEDSLKNAKNQHDSTISKEANIRIPTTDGHSEKSRESENSTPHRDTMGGGYKTANDVNEGTDDCVRQGESADENIANDNVEKKRDKVEDDGDRLRSEDRSSNKFNVKGVKILKRRKGIEMNETLAKYLVKSESQEAQFEFRHQFLAESLLRFHVEHFGKKGVTKVANEEVAFVLETL